jgi:hypothetical protein
LKRGSNIIQQWNSLSRKYRSQSQRVLACKSGCDSCSWVRCPVDSAVQFPLINFVSCQSVPCWVRQFDFINTMVTVTLGPILLGFAVVVVFFIFNWRKILRSNQHYLSDEKLAKLYHVPAELKMYFTKSDVKSLRRTFGELFFS